MLLRLEQNYCVSDGPVAAAAADPVVAFAASAPAAPAAMVFRCPLLLPPAAAPAAAVDR